MRKEIVILAAIVLITISAAVVAVAVANMSVDPGNSQQIKALTHDLAAQSRMTALDAAGDADVPPVLHLLEEPPDEYLSWEMPYDENLSRQIDKGHNIFFTPPRPFIVEAVGIIGMYNNESGYESGYVPFALELRDENGNLLYTLTDISVAYFPTKPRLTVIEIPAIKIDGEFSVTFYSRTSVFVGYYINTTYNMSYVVERGLSMNRILTEEGDPLDWAISVAGRYA